MIIAYAGERGAFGELAAIEYFGEKAKLAAVPEFSDVFSGVATGRFHRGVVPIENSLAGSIYQNLDLLIESDLHITGEVQLRIRQYLITNIGTSRRSIKQIFSHPAAIAQCKKFLKKFPNIQVVPTSNTATAVKKIKDEGLTDAAAIASMQAALDFDMHVAAKNIEDTKWNTTRFIIIAKRLCHPEHGTRQVKSSVVFAMKNFPGSLYKCLSLFALRDINLYKIESRPVHSKGFEYLFHLDFAGDARDEAQKSALRDLRDLTRFYRFLGSYAVDAPRDPKYRPLRT